MAKGLRIAEPLPSPRLEQSRDQPGREPAVIGRKGMLCGPVRLPDCLERGFGLVQVRLAHAPGIGEPAQQVV